MTQRASRRRFLAALGVSGACLLQETRGFADAAAKVRSAPLRYIGVYAPHGRAHELWQPRADFLLSYAGSTLGPFDDPATYGKSFRERLLVLDGIDLSAGIETGTTGHDGSRVILTGSGADGKNASLDQFLAVEQGLGSETPHTSLTLGVGSDSTEVGQNISWSRGGTPVPKWIDPSRVHAELFGAPLGARKEELEHERKLGKSLLDRVRADLQRLSRRAPASERTKLEQHATALRDIEKRLTHVERACAAPARPAGFERFKAYGGGEPYFDAITDLQIDLLARAVGCDLTRVATLYLADLTRSKLFAELPEDVHQEVAHRYDARDEVHAGTPESWQKLAIQNRYAYGKVARLLQRLDEAGALDSTLVHTSSDMGDPARHSSRQVPTLVIAGAAFPLKTGRYLDLRHGKNLQEGVPNNRLLVSLAQLFGAPIERFGESKNAGLLTGKLDALG
ncbi:MAG TPA: DUF1552 domain-containing protein [Polyangiaceae bacterium]|nr:DUF1552 domain-containing protein [Polyangiaceae bacterium]